MRWKMIAILCSILIGLFAFLRITKLGPDRANSSYSQFLEKVRSGDVAAVIIDARHSGASRATGKLKNGSVMRSVFPPDYRDAIATMQDKLVDIEIRDASSAVPFLVLLAVWIFMLPRLRNGARRGTAA